jgi:hypothetical protein
VIELPAYTRVTDALRLWLARSEDGREYRWGEAEIDFDDGLVPGETDDAVLSHPLEDHEQLWVLAGPIGYTGKGNVANRMLPPDFGFLVCVRCLPHAIGTLQLIGIEDGQR